MSRAITRALHCAGLAALAGLPVAATAQQGPTLSYAPMPGMQISFPLSAGTPVQSTIIVTPSGGTAGASTGLSCIVANPRQSFTVQPAFLGFPTGGSAQTLTVGCTPGINGLQIGTLQCLVSDGAGGVVTLTWPMSCPAVTPAPFLTSTPAVGQPVVLAAAPGTQANGGPVFGNAGLLSYQIMACTAGGSGFSIPAVFPFTVQPGASVPLAVACTTPAAAGTTTNGTLDCQTSMFGVSPNYPLQCTAVAPPPDAVFESSFEAPPVQALRGAGS